MADEISETGDSHTSKKKARPNSAYSADVSVSSVHSTKPRINRANSVSLVTKMATPVKRKGISAHVREVRAHSKELRAHAREGRTHAIELRERAREARKRAREAQEKAVETPECAKEPVNVTPPDNSAEIADSKTKRELAVVLFILALGFIILVTFILFSVGSNAKIVNSTTTSKSTTTIAPTSTIPANTPIKKVIVIVLENKGYNDVIGNGAAPYQTLLASRYAVASNYLAVARPSLPNYLAMVSGSSFGIDSDCLPSQCPLTNTTIVNLIEAKGLSWKEYAESMPGNCSQSNSPDGLYAPKHNPFVYFTNITGNEGFGRASSYCSTHDVSFGQFWADLEANALPSYSFITPNLCNDAHDCLLSVADQWLSTVVPSIINSSSFSSTALFIVYDEGISNSPSNRVALTLVSPLARQGYVSQVAYTHYSLLATIESLLGLGNLGRNDMTANVMSDLFA